MLSTHKNCTNTRHLIQKISIYVVSISNWRAYSDQLIIFSKSLLVFKTTVWHTQLKKSLCHQFLTMTLLTYGELYTTEVINKRANIIVAYCQSTFFLICNDSWWFFLVFTIFCNWQPPFFAVLFCKLV